MTSKMLDVTSIQNIVWVQTAFLGDIVLTTGAFHLCSKYFPDKRVIVVTTPLGVQALTGHPAIDHLIAFDKKAGNPLTAFRHVKSELAHVLGASSRSVLLQPHRSWRSSLLAQYLRMPIVTFKETRLSRFATWRVDRVPVLHEAQRNALLLQPLGVPRESLLSAQVSLPKQERLPIQQTWSQDIANVPEGCRLVGISVGSAWATKKWPLSRFKRLVEKLVALPDIGVVLLGSLAERSLTDPIAQEFSDRSQLWNLAGETSLDDLRWLYPRLSLLVSNDSSPVHYASAFSVPTVAIFGATTSSMGFGPMTPGSIVVENHELTCRPCSDHGPPACPLKHFDCMKTITVEQVFSTCRRVIDRP